ncbi:MAG: GGDEF domain-containing protein [Legionellaceae bacterium]|nr:GGDEF domain-containing protein [Legionellaceae bacterium]
MKLSSFILDNMESILQEWELFAEKLFPVSQQTNTKELRDHAEKMLLEITEILRLKIQNTENVENLSMIDSNEFLRVNAALQHGTCRLNQGMNIRELAAEFCALRSSVLTLFVKTYEKQNSLFYEQIQFNQLIDIILSNSIYTYTHKEEERTHVFDTLLSNVLDLTYILSLEGNFLYVNQAMADFCQKPPHKILGKAHYCAAMPSAAGVREAIEYVSKTGKKYTGDLTYKHPLLKSKCFVEFAFAPIYDKSKKNILGIAGVSRDITAQREAEQTTWHNANYDYLTDIANKRRFFDKLEEAIKYTTRSLEKFALFYIDLDKFKDINDELGHSSGDFFLKTIAKRIANTIRDVDIVARLGGDEFAVILTGNPNIKYAKQVVERLLSEVNKPIQIQKAIIHPSVSIGIVLSENDISKPEVMVKHADKAMYHAKKAGGNQYSFYHD